MNEGGCLMGSPTQSGFIVSLVTSFVIFVFVLPFSAIAGQDHAVLHTVVSLVGMCLVLCFYVVMWIKDGRDPDKGTIIPHFETPREMPPAVVRYLWKGSYDRQSFGAAILNMAVKGFLAISEKVDTSVPGPTYVLGIREGGDRTSLSKDEEIIAKALFPPGSDEIVLGRFDEERTWNAVAAQRRHLFWDYQRSFFASTRQYWKTIFYVLSTTGIAVVVVGKWWGVLAVLFASLFLCWATWWWLVVWTWRKKYFLLTLICLFVALATTFGTPIVAMFPYVIYRSTSPDNGPIFSSLLTATILASSALAAIPFYRLVQAPTRVGRKFLDQLEGFRLFLEQTEKGRLEMSYPDDRFPDDLNHNLPYALALDIDLPLLSRFSSALPTIVGPGQGGKSGKRTGVSSS
jgi:hypothetical protein